MPTALKIPCCSRRSENFGRCFVTPAKKGLSTLVLDLGLGKGGGAGPVCKLERESPLGWPIAAKFDMLLALESGFAGSSTGGRVKERFGSGWEGMAMTWKSRSSSLVRGRLSGER